MLGLLLCGVAAPALAADLTVAWKASTDEVTEGYDVEVLNLDGEILQTLDAGDATRVACAFAPTTSGATARARPAATS